MSYSRAFPARSRALWFAPFVSVLVAGCFGAPTSSAVAQGETAKKSDASSVVPAEQPISIGVDKNVQFQRIDGFGAFGGKTVFWGNPPFYDAPFLKTIVDDLGMTILRVEVPTSFEMVNDNNDPFVTDLSKFNLTESSDSTAKTNHSPLAPHLDYIKALKTQANRSGEPLKLIASIWSPPYWMKYTKSIFGEDAAWNRLIMKEIPSAEKPDDYKDEFAEYCVAYCKIVEQKTGVPVYALSLQNELAFAQSYQSSVYSAEQYRNIVRHVGARFKKEGLETKLFGPEDVPVYARMAEYVNVLGADKAARDALDIVAIHGYGPDGKAVNATPDDEWKQYYRLASQWNKPHWMTETSGYSKDWTGGLQLAQNILSALKYGRISAWVFWQLSEDNATLSLMDNGVPTPRYYASKQFYRTIRPGAVQIQTASPDKNVQVVGFSHAAQKTTTLVVINGSDQTRRVALKMTGSNLPKKFSVMRSSATQNAVKLADVAANRVLDLPARSVTTLVGQSAGTDKPVAPRFVMQPQSAKSSEGQSVTLMADVAGTPDITYQWQRNGVAIPDATGNVLTVSSLRESDDGAQYTLVARNAVGTTSSTRAMLKVAPFAGFTIARTAVTPKIDGDIDSAWRAVPFQFMKQTVIGKDIAAANLSAGVKALWDNDALYVFYAVKDQKVWTPGEGDGDSVELIIDGDNSKSLAYGDNDFQFVFGAGSDAKPVETKHNAVAGVASAVIKRPDGYTLEARIPWKTLGIAPSADKLIGLDFNVNDSDGKERIGKIALFSANNDIWFNPGLAGVGKLLK